MLHELLLALLGFTGDFVIDEREQAETLGLDSHHQFPEEPTFKLAPDLSFLHPSERSLIERLVSLGFYYKELDQFATKSRNLSFIHSAKSFSLSQDLEVQKDKVRKGSAYRRAIANGLVEILSVYRAAVLQIEQNLLSDPLPILATVTQGLNKFEVLLPPLYELIVEIEREDIRGGQLLNLLHKRCHCGVPELQACIQRLLWHGHQVMYNQLASWMVYGILQDQHGEFFIQRSIVHGLNPCKLAIKMSAQVVEEQPYCYPLTPVRIIISSTRYAIILMINHQQTRNFSSANHLWSALGPYPFNELYARQDGRSDDSELSHSEQIKKFMEKSADETTLTDWHSGFHISLEMLPEYIHMRVAESILFAGKAVRVLRNPTTNFRLQESFMRQLVLKGSSRIQSYIETFSSQREVSPVMNLIAEDLLPQSEADKIDAMLKELKKSSEFQKRLFESAVGSIRIIAANHLWQLVVVRADLNGHLKALKDYFLLAKGDFFQCFLEESRQLMRLPPRQSTAEADLMVPFQLAALKTVGDEDKYFSRVSLRMPSFGINMSTSQVDLKTKSAAMTILSQGKTSSESSVDGWDGIALEYSVDWPLQLFFTQEVISKYRKVFQYLIRLKRTQMELEKSWAAVMHQDHIDFAKNRKDRKNNFVPLHRRQRSTPMWRVREHMTFLIRNLQFYIQVDVIESQWNLLQAHLQDSHDFTELVGFHQEVKLLHHMNGNTKRSPFELHYSLQSWLKYLAALISQSFLDIGSVSRILDSIMKLCLQFCWSIEQYERNPNMSELEHIAEEFNKKSNSLYTILRSSRLAGSQRAPFLRQFLMRLNFNSFFEQTARGVLNVVRARPTMPLQQE